MDRSQQFFDAQGELIETLYNDISWALLRQFRDNELDNSDWRFMSDQSPSQEWIDYRIFLRDLPQHHESANDAADAWNEYEKPEGA